MKSLFLIRHAKSSWTDITKPDFERPLNDRGKRDAPVMATRLSKRGKFVNVFLSSPANRAKETCKYFCNEYGVSENRIVYNERLYHASVQTFYEVVRGLDDEIRNIAIFSHNPGITDFVNTLCKNVKVDNIPTCGMFGVELNVRNWREFRESENKFLFFDHPKA